MSCRQFFPVRLAQGATADRFLGVAGDGFAWLSTAPLTGGTMVRWSGTWTNFIFQHLTAPGSGKTFVYTLVKNGVDTAIVITIADLAVEGRSTSTLSVVTGDKVYWRRSTTGTPTLSEVRYISEFMHTAAYLNGYHGYDNISNSSTFRAPLFSPSTWSGGIAGNNNSVVAVPGNLTELYYEIDQAPGSGKSYVMALEINGVTQDGSGGTTDTRATIADSATTASWSGSIALSAGDYCALTATPSGTPTVVEMAISITFAPTTDGESNLSGTIQQNLPTTGTNYLFPAQTFGSSISTNEADCDVIGGVSDFDLRRFYIRVGATIGTGPCTWNTRQNGAGTGQTLTITSGNQTGSDTSNTATISDGDTWSLEFVATGSPGIARIASQSWALFALAAATPVVGTSIFGEDGTVQALSHVSFFKLAGTPRTLSDPALEGSVCIDGVLTMYEQASAPAAVAGTGRLWFEDNGAGKLRAMLQFPSGAAVQIAIEP